MSGLIIYRHVGPSIGPKHGFGGIGTANVRYIGTKPTEGLQHALVNATTFADKATAQTALGATGRSSSNTHYVATGQWPDISKALETNVLPELTRGSSLHLWPQPLPHLLFVDAVSRVHEFALAHSLVVSLRLPSGGQVTVQSQASARHYIDWSSTGVTSLPLGRTLEFFRACNAALPFEQQQTQVRFRKGTLSTPVTRYKDSVLHPAFQAIDSLQQQAGTKLLRGQDITNELSQAAQQFDALVALCDEALHSPLFLANREDHFVRTGYRNELAESAHVYRAFSSRLQILEHTQRSLKKGTLPWILGEALSASLFPHSILGMTVTHARRMQKQYGYDQSGIASANTRSLDGLSFADATHAQQFREALDVLHSFEVDTEIQRVNSTVGIIIGLGDTNVKIRYVGGMQYHALYQLLATRWGQLNLPPDWSIEATRSSATLSIPRDAFIPEDGISSFGVKIT